MAAKLPALAEQYANHPIVAALGVYNAETGDVDLDALYQAAKPYIGTDALPIKIPLTGITLKIGQREINNLYSYIKEGM